MITKEFALAGNATFTVELPAERVANGHKPHYTFKVTRSEPTERFPRPAIFIGYLSGPNNQDDYSYLGMVHEDTGAVRTTAKSRNLDGSFIHNLANRTMQRIVANECHVIESAGYKVHHEGRCGRCGRPLTTPESIESGIGPICAGRV